MRVVPPSTLPEVGARLVTTAALKYPYAASDSTEGEAKSSLLTVTLTVEEDAEAGEKQDKVVLEIKVASATTSPNLHFSPAMSAKFFPTTTTLLPPARSPEVGESDVTEGGERIVNCREVVV
jgi:hypothetical protein